MALKKDEKIKTLASGIKKTLNALLEQEAMPSGDDGGGELDLDSILGTEENKSVEPGMEGAETAPVEELGIEGELGTEEGGEKPVSDEDAALIDALKKKKGNISIVSTDDPTSGDGTTDSGLGGLLESEKDEDAFHKFVDYVVERVVMKFNTNPPADGIVDIEHKTVAGKLAKEFAEQNDEGEEEEKDETNDPVEFKKSLVDLESKYENLKESYETLSNKYVSLLEQFTETLKESESYLEQNELFWRIYETNLTEPQKIMAIKKVRDLELNEAEKLVGALQKVKVNESKGTEKAPRTSARPFVNEAVQEKLLEHVRGNAQSQDAPPKASKGNEVLGDRLMERVLRNANLKPDTDF